MIGTFGIFDPDFILRGAEIPEENSEEAVADISHTNFPDIDDSDIQEEPLVDIDYENPEIFEELIRVTRLWEIMITMTLYRRIW